MAGEDREFRKPAWEAVESIAGELGALVQLVRAGCADACLIALRDQFGDECVWAPCAAPPTESVRRQILNLLTSWVIPSIPEHFVVRRLSPSDAAALRPTGIPVRESDRMLLQWRTQRPQNLVVGVLAGGRSLGAKALLKITARCATYLSGQRRQARLTSFWQAQAEQLRDDLSEARAQATAIAREGASHSSIVRGLAASLDRGGLPLMAAAFTRLEAFDGWLIAAGAQDGVKITAAHGVAAGTEFGSRGALTQAFERCTTIYRPIDPLCPVFPEDRLFGSAGYRSYLCVGFEGGVLGLLSRRTISEQTRRRVEDLAGWMDPYLKSWWLNQELSRQRALVRRLIQGLFAAVDGERSRLRRDLHDDWAQMLAAAQIALEGPPDGARRVFRELQGRLHKQLDALHSPTFARTTLRHAISTEVRRLEDAGVRSTVNQTGTQRLPAFVKDLCCRVIREGVSNVIRHAGADSAHLEVEYRRGSVQIALTDNGRGLDKNGASSGTGLDAMAERVGLIGGSCRLESGLGWTRLSARIPVADL